MNLFVTGGAGYIGSICVEMLLENGHEVVVVDNLHEGHREAVLPEAIFYKGDFGDRDLLQNIFQKHPIDAVMHFAAETTMLAGPASRADQRFALTTEIAEDWGMQLAYRIKHEFEPQPGTQATDSHLNVSIVRDF